MSEPWENWRPTFTKRLNTVLDETQADTVLELLAPELAAWAEYENAVTWHTECLSCANMLSSCIKETVRAETAEAARDSALARCEEMNEAAVNHVRRIGRLKQQVEELSQALDDARNERDAATERAIGYRESLRSSRATVRELREAKDRSVGSLLHEAARRMKDTGHDEDAVTFLDLLAARQTEDFLTDIPEDTP